MAASEGRLRRLMGLLAVACVVLQFGGSLGFSGLALSLWLTAMACFKPAVLRRLWMPRFWMLTALFALGSGFLLGPKDLGLGPLRLSSVGLGSGALMMVRGAFIFALASWASVSLSGDGLRRVARRLGMGQLAEAVGVALRLLPELSQRLAVARAGAPSTGRMRFVYGAAVDLIAETARLAAELGEGGSQAGGRAEEGERLRLPLVAVVGMPDSGKTRSLEISIRLLRRAGLQVGGVLQPKLLVNGRVEGYDLQDVASDERRSFARRCADCSDPRVGFDFSEEGWSWAAEILRRAALEADVVVVDELGWLEADGEGHGPALGALPAGGRARFVMAAVRSVCAPAIERRWGEFACRVESDIDEQGLRRFVEDLACLAGKVKR